MKAHPFLSKYRELVKSSNNIVLRIKFTILIIPRIKIVVKIKALIKISKKKHNCTPIQNRKMYFKSLKWIILGVHLIENYFFYYFILKNNNKKGLI